MREGKPVKLRIHRMPGKRRGPWFEHEDFTRAGYRHRYWFAGRLMAYLMTVRP